MVKEGSISVIVNVSGGGSWRDIAIGDLMGQVGVIIISSWIGEGRKSLSVVV